MTAQPEEPEKAERLARITAAFEADPALAEELAMITAALGPEARERFDEAFADELASHARPAAAVLAALSRAARG